MSFRLPLLFGWGLLACFIVFGLFLEFLHLIKAPFYLEVEIRRELWVLGHAHGTLLSVLTILFALTGRRLELEGKGAGRASLLVIIAALLVPGGFILGGFGNSETDPSLWIALTPIGALCLLAAVIYLFVKILRARDGR